MPSVQLEDEATEGNGLTFDTQDFGILTSVSNAILDFITEYRVFKIPLLNWAVILVYVWNIFKLSLRYSKFHSVWSWGTVMLTNLLLYGLADTLAQTLRSVAAFQSNIASQQDVHHSSLFLNIIEKGRPRRVILDEEDDDLVELGLAIPQPDEPSDIPLTHPEIFNFRRLALFSAWGFIISWFQAPWYAFLNSTYGHGNKLVSTIQRVLVDQLFYSPISLACFLTYLTVVVEGRDKSAIKPKLMASYLPTLAMNYTIWPIAQFTNFLLIPASLQIPFSSTISVFWNAYLSLKNPS